MGRSWGWAVVIFNLTRTLLLTDESWLMVPWSENPSLWDGKGQSEMGIVPSLHLDNVLRKTRESWRRFEFFFFLNIAYEAVLTAGSSLFVWLHPPRHFLVHTPSSYPIHQSFCYFVSQEGLLNKPESSLAFSVLKVWKCSNRKCWPGFRKVSPLRLGTQCGCANAFS